MVYKMEYKFRAFYTLDIDENENLPFYSKTIGNEMYFVCEDDHEIKYQASLVFGDKDWIIDIYVGKDMDNKDIYTSDILLSKLPNGTNECYYVMYDEEYCEYRAVNKNDNNFMLPIIWSGTKVIGNIHFNEVLLDNLDNPSIGQYQIINFDGKNVYLKLKWFRNNQDLQDHIDKVYKEIYEYIKGINRKIRKLESRNLFQRIFRKYE